MEGERMASFLLWPKLFFVLTCILCFCVVLSTETEKVPPGPKKGHPVILIPGDGGTQLWASLDKPSTVHYYCRQKESLFNLWLNVEELVPYLVDCFVDNARLEYNNKTRTSSSPPGVNITVVDFGNTSSVEYLDPSKISLSKYFNAIVDGLVAVGYQRGVSVRGAPYDFRKAPNEARVFFHNLTLLIEDTYRINGNRKVVLITHSLGCLYGVYFLNKQSKTWKAKYIQAFAPISGPFAGVTKSIRVMISGDNVGDFVVAATSIRKAQRSWPSLSFLMVSDKYWEPDEVIVSTQKKNYTVKDYRQLFKDLKYEVGWELYEDVNALVYDLIAPGVPVYGIHGRDVPTEEYYLYNSEKPFPDYQPYITYGQGDGTVNMRSLKAYMKWQHEQVFPVSEFEISGGEHVSILQNATLVKYLIKTVLHLP